MRGLTFPGLGSGCWALSFEKPTDKINTPCLVLDLTAPARHLQTITCSQMAQTFIERLLCFEGLPIQWGRLTAGGEDTARGTSHPRGVATPSPSQRPPRNPHLWQGPHAAQTGSEFATSCARQAKRCKETFGGEGRNESEEGR